MHRLCVHRTPRHIYAQIISADGARVLASASTLDSEVKQSVGYGGNVSAARRVGQVVAERALKAGVEQVAFDRSGFRYHGRVRVLAEEAREKGLKF
jgi:large subunit ribosomal protein L18